MRKSLFPRYFLVCMCMILVSVVVLGVVFIFAVEDYFKTEKISMLKRNVHQAELLTISNYKANNLKFLDTQLLKSGYSILGQAVESEIFLTDSEGRSLICSHDSECIHDGLVVESEILEIVKLGNFAELGRLGGVYSDSYYTVATPIYTADGELLVIVFASASAQSQELFVRKVIEMYLLSAGLVLAVSSIITYYITRRWAQPLEKMVSATQSFSKGDFTTRVPVEGYDEIGRLAVAFNNMASALAMQDISRRSFTANVSHELKTPMTTIGGYIDGMLDGTIPAEKHEQYLKVVSGEVKRLSRVVKSMLDMSKIEAGEMNINPITVDINEIVLSVIFTFEHAIEEKNMEVRGLDSGKIFVKCDPDLIHQVVYNLVDNAVKFSNPGGYIEVGYKTEGGRVRISIKNSGDGISEEERKKIFERFYKSDTSRSLDKKGVGLGLHIVKYIVNLHSSQIMVDSVEGEYSEFSFTLTAAKTGKASLFSSQK